MRPVGARAGGELGMPVEQQRRALVLHRRRKRLDVIDPRRASSVCGQAQQDGGDVGRAERLRKLICELLPGSCGSHEIEPRAGRLGSAGFCEEAMEIDCPCNRAVWGRLYTPQPYERVKARAPRPEPAPVGGRWSLLPLYCEPSNPSCRTNVPHFSVSALM